MNLHWWEAGGFKGSPPRLGDDALTGADQKRQLIY
jgi:hypothetical protein